MVIRRPDGTVHASGDIHQLFGEIAPEIDWRFLSDEGPVDRVAVAAAMDLWADGLRAYLPGLIATAGSD